LALSGKALSDLLDDAGDVDPSKVDAVAAEVLALRPGLRPPSPVYDRSQGLGGEPAKPTATFADLLKD
jgi:hypothetical protein